MLEKPLLIDGVWCAPSGDRTLTIFNPGSGEAIGALPLCEAVDLDDALQATKKGFAVWREKTALERSQIMHEAARLVSERLDAIARLITLEQGKPIDQAMAEVRSACEHIRWHAEEGRRIYGRVIPSRITGARQIVLREPVGPVVAFTPWNFPVNQLVRKISAALAAGCSIIAKPPEATPSSCIELVRAFHDAGLPAGVLGLVFGEPPEVSKHLINAPEIRKVSFTGSVPVGKSLAAMAAAGLKRTTMELGGHAPYIVARDADIAAAARVGVAVKFRNAGQICASPTRFYVEDSVYEAFRDAFVAGAKAVETGDGFDGTVQMGPLTHARRVTAMEQFVEDATARGATLECGGRRLTNRGFFYEPTVLGDVPEDASVMNEEPFGPIAALARVSSVAEAIERANRLPFGLAAYGFTRSLATADTLVSQLEAGAISINHFDVAAPETPFGGVKESGSGSEGGSESLDAYLTTKFASHIGV